MDQDLADKKIPLYHGYFITAVAAVAQVCVYPGTSAGMTWVVDGHNAWSCRMFTLVLVFRYLP